jgi:uncharacterized protein YdeI (YjbR/CyaY-like superfamily)
MNKPNPKVDGLLRKAGQWREELARLRAIALDCPLVEDVKWRHPCYTFEGSNIIILGGFKNWCVMTFVKGALLKDPRWILVKPGENTQAARMAKFTDLQQIVELEAVLKAYIHEAIAVEKAGLKVKLKTVAEFKLPEELQAKFDKDPRLQKAFSSLTPGRQRRYILHFSSAKQSATRSSRIEKCTQRILAGKGLDDK